MLSMESRRVAGDLLVVFPTVLYGGVSRVMFLTDPHFGLHGQSVATESVSCRPCACWSVAGLVADRTSLCG